jgi:hypothetical protein
MDAIFLAETEKIRVYGKNVNSYSGGMAKLRDNEEENIDRILRDIEDIWVSIEYINKDIYDKVYALVGDYILEFGESREVKGGGSSGWYSFDKNGKAVIQTIEFRYWLQHLYKLSTMDKEKIALIERKENITTEILDKIKDNGVKLF